MDDASLTALLVQQDGVVARAQVLACGGDDVLIERYVRTRRWRRVHPGVYVDHTGPLTCRLGHDAPTDRWDDLERDIDAATTGRVTLRAGWRQVLAPCRLATAVAAVLGARGWTGQVRACGPGCGTSEADRGEVPAPGAGGTPPSARTGS